MNDGIGRLTDRQKDCLRLVASGYTSKEIGRRLGISYTTVDNHIRLALEVLGVASRAEAARVLAAGEADQPLTSQPPELAPGLEQGAQQAAADMPGPTGRRLVPPLGGSRNALRGEDRVYAVLKVAVLGFSGLAALTMGIVGLLWLLR